MAVTQEQFLAYLNEKKPFSFFLDEKIDRLFRNALRIRSPQVVDYLLSDEILADLIDALVNEETRSIQEASESHQIILNDIDPIIDKIIQSHLATIFNYLDRENLQPRRVYFFLKVMSYLFQNRMYETFSFVNEHPEVVVKLFKHIKSPHVLQLVLNMLAVERQYKEMREIDVSWSEKCNLASQVVGALNSNAEENLEPIHKFLREISLSYPSDSPFLKNLISAHDSALIKITIDLMQNKNLALDAVKLLDQVIIVIIMDNKEDTEFHQNTINQMTTRKEVFKHLLESNSLISALAGVKLYYSFVRHKLESLVEGGIVIAFNIMMKFKWSNVIHAVVQEMLIYVITSPDTRNLLKELVTDGHLLDKIIEVLKKDEAVGYKGHFRNLANLIVENTQIHEVIMLDDNENWKNFQDTLQLLNEKNSTFQFDNNGKDIKSQVVSMDSNGDIAQALFNNHVIGSPMPTRYNSSPNV